jgi:hypothetical protein
MLSMTLLNTTSTALQLSISGLPGAIACLLLFTASCVARAQTGRMNKRASRLRPASRDERMATNGGRCNRERL